MRFVSSIIAVSEPFMGMPARANSSAPTLCSSPDMVSKAQSLGQAPRRIDGEAQDALAPLGGRDAERGGRRGLAHAAGAHGDDHAS